MESVCLIFSNTIFVKSILCVIMSVGIVSFCRTPFCPMGGKLSGTTAADLASTALGGVIARSGLEKTEIDGGYILGQAVSSGSGPQSALKVWEGLFKGNQNNQRLQGSCFTVSNGLLSSLRASVLGAHAIMTKEADFIAVGGVESFSQAPWLLRRGSVGGVGDRVLEDSIVSDFGGPHFRPPPPHPPRSLQDSFAFSSLRKYNAALSTGLSEIQPVGPVLKDIVKSLTADTLASQKSVEDGATSGNSSFLADGASALILADMEIAKQKGVRVRGRLLGWSTDSVKTLLTKTNTSSESIKFWEIHESSAHAVLGLVRNLGIDLEKVNPRGGAIVLGSPVGAVGASLVGGLMESLESTGGGKGVVFIKDGPQAIAMLIEV